MGSCGRLTCRRLATDGRVGGGTGWATLALFVHPEQQTLVPRIWACPFGHVQKLGTPRFSLAIKCPAMRQTQAGMRIANVSWLRDVPMIGRSHQSE